MTSCSPGVTRHFEKYPEGPGDEVDEFQDGGVHKGFAEVFCTPEKL